MNKCIFCSKNLVVTGAPIITIMYNTYIFIKLKHREREIIDPAAMKYFTKSIYPVWGIYKAYIYNLFIKNIYLAISEYTTKFCHQENNFPIQTCVPPSNLYVI